MNGFVDSSGRILIPKAIRDQIDIKPRDLVDFEITDGSVRLFRVDRPE